MKRTKKMLVVLLSAMLSLALILTGCSSGTKTASTASPDQTVASAAPSVAPAKQTLKPYEVVMVYPDGPHKDLQKVQDAMNAYLKQAYPEMNATIKLNPIDWSAWSDKTNLMFASNEKFDTLFTANWFAFDQQVNKGALLPLDDLLKQYGPDIEKVEKDYHTGAMRNGKVYGIHTHQELGGQQGIVFRKDLVDKYKFDLNKISASKNIADIEPMLKTIKDNEPGVTPMVGAPFPLEQHFRAGSMDMVIEPVGLDISKGDLKVVNMYETARYMELAHLTHKWNTLGYINKDSLSTTQGVNGRDHLKAKTGFAIVGNDMEILKDNHSPQLMPTFSAEAGFDLIQVPMSWDGLRTAKLAGTMQAISKTSQDPARAMMVLNLFFGDKKLINMFNYGIEGVHYVLKNGQVDEPAGLTHATNPFEHGIQWEIGNQFLNYTIVGEDPNKYENYNNFNNETVQHKSIMLGFVFNSEPVKNELVAMDNVRKTYDPGLDSGTLDPDVEVPNLVKKLKAAGLDKVITEAQKQLDAWRAANGK